MSASIRDKRNVKIFLLYLLENINYPLELCEISDIVMQTDYVLFLDFAESFNELTDSGLIDEISVDGKSCYIINSKGRTVAQSLKSDLLSSMLDKALEAALRYIDFGRREIEAECEILHTNILTGECDVHCILREKKKVIFDATLHADSQDRARRMKENFENRPDVVFRGYTALLAGNINYLFDK